jgi:hypothetical protein
MMMLTSETITKIMPSLIKAQGEFAPAVKAKVNPHFKSKYVPLDVVLDAIAEPLRNNGIAIIQQTDILDGRMVLLTRLVHESGEWIAGRYPVQPVKADPQGEGSALTYARRYALMAIAGIAPEDDDGNAAVKAVQREPATVTRILPTDGVWEAQDEEQQAFLLKIAEAVFDLMPDADAALAHIEEQKLDADEKTALWTRFDSKTRTALKKAHNAKEAA